MMMHGDGLPGYVRCTAVLRRTLDIDFHTMLSKHSGEELEPGGDPADSIHCTYSRCVECINNQIDKSLLAPTGIGDGARQKTGCGISPCSDRRRGSLNQHAMLNVQQWRRYLLRTWSIQLAHALSCVANFGEHFAPTVLPHMIARELLS